jgi:hypothetical protein
MTSQPSASRAAGAFAVIANMKIRAKIFLAFGALIGIMAISSGIAVVSFSTTSDLFHDYEEVGNLATAAQEVERELAELDQHVEQYAATGDPVQRDKVLELEKALSAQVEHAKALATNDDEKAEIVAVAATFEHVIAGFEKASVIEEGRAKLARDVLDVAGPKLAADLEDIALKAAQEGNSNAVIMANAALYEAMKARLNANLVLARHEKGKADAAETAFHDLGKALAQLEKVTGASAYKAEVADATALGTKYEEAFKESETLDEQFAEILEAEIIKPSEEAIADAEKVKTETAQRETEDGEALSATIGSSEILILVLAIAATAVGFWGRSTVAALLLMPYLAWTTFAAVLNFAIWRMNS